MYLLLGARMLDDHGCILVYRGDDLAHFELVSTIETARPFGYMWERPDFATIGGRDVLLCCPQGIAHESHRFQNAHQCGWFPFRGSLEGDHELGEFQQWDFGFDFYAASLLRAGGRVLLVGWMGIADAPYGRTPSTQAGWDQVLAMPRELAWHGGRVCQRPLRELRALRGREVALETGGTTTLSARSFRLAVAPEKASDITIRLREDAVLAYDAAADELALRMGKVCGAGREERRMRPGGLRSLEVYVDASTLEVFVNEGQGTMTSRIFGEADETVVEPFCGTASWCEMGAFRYEGQPGGRCAIRGASLSHPARPPDGMREPVRIVRIIGGEQQHGPPQRAHLLGSAPMLHVQTRHGALCARRADAYAFTRPVICGVMRHVDA